MAPRPIWRGHLRLALVSCPVALYNARHDREAIRFNQINPATGNRIKMITQDAGTGQEVRRGELAKGYEFEKDRYLILSDEDFEKVKPESSSILSVEKFVDAGSIDPVYYDSAYYMAPDGHTGDDVYAVLHEAIQKTGKVALSRVVISQRERTIALRVIDGGLMAHTLYEQRDLNDARGLFTGVEGQTRDPELVALAVELIKRQSSPYSPDDLEDRYETRLREMIDAKLAGMPMVAEPQPTVGRGNVIDLVAALKKSLAAATKEAEDAPTPVKARKEADRRQTGLKLPIAGGKQKTSAAPVVEQPAVSKPRRKAS
jgi:DNA end-binding protein Ku